MTNNYNIERVLIVLLVFSVWFVSWECVSFLLVLCWPSSFINKNHNTGLKQREQHYITKHTNTGGNQITQEHMANDKHKHSTIQQNRIEKHYQRPPNKHNDTQQRARPYNNIRDKGHVHAQLTNTNTEQEQQYSRYGQLLPTIVNTPKITSKPPSKNAGREEP